MLKNGGGENVGAPLPLPTGILAVWPTVPSPTHQAHHPMPRQHPPATLACGEDVSDDDVLDSTLLISERILLISDSILLISESILLISDSILLI